MSRTILLTLGRLPHAIELARGFSRAGWRVIVAEPQRWHLTGMSRHVARCFRTPAPMRDPRGYLAALAAIVRRARVDLVVPVSDETMHVAGLSELIGDDARIFAPPQDAVVRLHDKHGFIALAKTIGLPTPETHALGNRCAEALARRQKFVLKPAFSCSGRGVRILPAGADLPAPDPAARAIIQAFLPGEVYSSFALADQGRLLANVLYRGLSFSGAVAVAFERIERHPGMENWIERFVAATGHSGFISFDFIVDVNGAAQAIECNPRVTSGIHFLEPDDLVAAMLDPTGARAVRFRPGLRRQQFYAALTAVQSAALRGDWRLAAQNGRGLATGPDVVWRASDPLPFLTMIPTSSALLWRAARTRAPIAELVTDDIGWRETQ